MSEGINITVAKIKKDTERILEHQEKQNGKLKENQNRIRALENKDLQKQENCPYSETIVNLKENQVSYDAIKKHTTKLVRNAYLIMGGAIAVITFILEFVL